VNKRSKGVALIEIAVGLTLVSFILVASFSLLSKGNEVTKAKSISSDWTQFATAADAHFTSNRSAYIAAMTDGTDADRLCKVNVDSKTGEGGIITYDETLHRCAIDSSMLKFHAALPSTASDINPYRERWVAIFKLVYDRDDPPKPTGGVESFIVSATVDGSAPIVLADPKLYDNALTASGYTQGNGGVVPDADRATCIASRALNRYESCGAGWKINLPDFLTTTEVQAFANRLSK
jgi:hypothetical protein